MAPTPPLYADWHFWTAVIALLALGLSQIPPLSVLLRRTRIEVEPYTRFALTHWLGNPNIHWHLQLRNTGGRQVSVVGLRLVMSTDDNPKATWELPAQNFSRPGGDASALLFTRFALKPDEEWANVVTFFPVFGLDDERRSKRLIKDLRNNIVEKLRQQKAEAREEPGPAEADAALVAPIVDFYRAHNIWRAVEYNVALNVQCEPARASTSRTFRFVLFESDIQDLEERTTRYQIGAGVYYSDDAATEVFPRIKEVS